jgi:hypothetical protein
MQVLISSLSAISLKALQMQSNSEYAQPQARAGPYKHWSYIVGSFQ